jgi:ribosomal-protein-alanine N-acetyltransferase
VNAGGQSSSFTIELVPHDPAKSSELEAIELACFGERGARITEEVTRPWARIWAVRAEGASEGLAGYLLSWHVADELHVLSVATLPPLRRRGIGRALIEAALAYAGAHGVRLVLLEVRQSNCDAISLYRAAGFAVTGVRRAYYSEPEEDAVEMAVALDPNTGARVAPTDSESG